MTKMAKGKMKITIAMLGPFVLAGLHPCKRRHSESAPESAPKSAHEQDANQGQGRLRVRLPENRILLLHDRGQDRGSMLLRHRGWPAHEGRPQR